VGLAPEDRLLVVAALRRHVRLDADDRLDARLDRLLVELVGAVHVAVVGHAHGRHAQPLGLGKQRPDLRGTVVHRVLGVNVKMDERAVGHRLQLPPAPLADGPREAGLKPQSNRWGLTLPPAMPGPLETAWPERSASPHHTGLTR